MTHPVVRPLRLVSHSPMLECDVSRRIGWYVRWPNGERGRIRQTRDEARAEAKGLVAGDDHGARAGSPTGHSPSTADDAA